MHEYAQEHKTFDSNLCFKCGLPLTKDNITQGPLPELKCHKDCRIAEEKHYQEFHDKISKGKTCNSVTPHLKPQLKPEMPKKQELPYREVYQFATELTHEQNKNQSFFWTKQAERLVRRLQLSKNQLIAVIGYQGSGKSTLLSMLWDKLENCHGLKWFGEKSAEENLEFFAEPDLENLISYLHLKNSEEELRHWVGSLPTSIANTVGAILFSPHADEHLKNPQYTIIAHSIIEKKLGQATLQEAKKDWLAQELSKGTILIDLPDYDKNNRTQMIHDLNAIHKFWQNIDVMNEGSRETNIVLFMQKELFHNHFFFGKMDVIDLELLKPQDFIQYYTDKFGSTKPFEVDALREIAYLSRGIFRRFKKYIRICLDNFYDDSEKGGISVEDVQLWISQAQLSKDMELELSSVFHSRELHNYTVTLLQVLGKNGSVDQQELSTQVFGEGKAAEMQCSRVLQKLEAYGYIKREVHDNNKKMVSLGSP